MATEQKILTDFLARLPPGKNPYRASSTLFERYDQATAYALMVPSSRARYSGCVLSSLSSSCLCDLHSIEDKEILPSSSSIHWDFFSLIAPITWQYSKASSVLPPSPNRCAETERSPVICTQAGQVFSLEPSSCLHFCVLFFQWLCVCNCALLEWKPMEAHPTREEYFMPRILVWILHGWLALTGFMDHCTHHMDSAGSLHRMLL
ncbi:hypothetical protein DFH28DRAFT_5253 [Melampsora americana]|nr:hypothetical protein DFH28DRAFT_5253 [Melampsora americana]